MIVKCNRCGREVPLDNSYQHLGETLCEDCYIDVRYPAKACDPWAVYSATQSRESAGLEGTEGLTELQQKIYDFVKAKGKVTREEIMANFNIKEMELQTNLATLRHCELVKGRKEGNCVYLVPFDFDE
jgi:recombinational DNA repair protein (RecF pathway)